MRKSVRVLISLVIFLQACSVLPFQADAQPTGTPAATKTATITLPPSSTPASITPTITPSPTIVHIPTQDPNLPTSTFAPITIFIGSETATSAPLPGVIPSATVFSPGAGFVSVDISDNKIFWGSCKPNRSKVVAKIEDRKHVASIVIFVQLRSFFKEDYTPWSTGDIMFDNRDGAFTYTLKANEIEGHNHYQ